MVIVHVYTWEMKLSVLRQILHSAMQEVEKHVYTSGKQCYSLAYLVALEIRWACQCTT